MGAGFEPHATVRASAAAANRKVRERTRDLGIGVSRNLPYDGLELVPSLPRVRVRVNDEPSLFGKKSETIRAMERMLEATARAEDRHFWFIGLRRNAEQVLNRALGGRTLERIVDCGAGTGRNLDWLSRFGRPIGIELTPAGLEIGRAHGRPMVRGSVAALPFATASADLMTSFDVLYCLEDDEERRALAEMARVLRPGGLALINVAALDILRGAHSTLTHEVRRYTPARLRQRLAQAGFEVERLTFTNMATFPATLAVRTFDRISGRVAVASDADLRVPSPIINGTFDLALRAEAVAMRWIDLPIGTSLLCLARKPGTAPHRRAPRERTRPA